MLSNKYLKHAFFLIQPLIKIKVMFIVLIISCNQNYTFRSKVKVMSKIYLAIELYNKYINDFLKVVQHHLLITDFDIFD